jgi:toxin ParE1/3/4
MRRLEFTPRARRDIEEIWEYSFERFGLDKAQAYLRGIQRAAMTVTEDPRCGFACDEIRSGYRKFSVGSRVLFFRGRRPTSSLFEISMREGTSIAISVDTQLPPKPAARARS